MRNWPYLWYGYWQEYGADYAPYPSAHAFVDPVRTACYDLARLLAYLRSGYPLLATSRVHFPSPFTGHRSMGALCFVMDGTWYWLDDLADYVEGHHLAIPDTWYATLEANCFLMSVFTERQLQQLPLFPPDLPGPTLVYVKPSPFAIRTVSQIESVPRDGQIQLKCPVCR